MRRLTDAVEIAIALGTVGLRVSAGDRVVTVEQPRPVGYRSPPPNRATSGTPAKAYREPDGGHKPHQGSRETARRRRQMLRAKLKAEARAAAADNGDGR